MQMDFRTLTYNEVNALAPHTFKYSVPILQYHSKDENYVGSGTLVQVGSRFFVATAAHNLTNDKTGVPDNCLYLGYTKNVTHEPFPFCGRKPSAGEKEPSIDVDYIEISHKIARSMTEKEFLPLNRIRPFTDFWPTRVFLTGFPAGIVPLEAARRKKFHLDAIGYLTETRKPDSSECKGNKSTDIFVDYEETSILVQNQEVITMPKPQGLSGGGLWALPIARKGTLWRPSDTTLIGIQRKRVKTAPAILCCTQIQHWLTSVADCYSDLREIIYCYLQSINMHQEGQAGITNKRNCLPIRD